jgi:hypothetical protein
MKLAEAGKGHLIVGVTLALVSLTLGIISLIVYVDYLGLLTFFFGVWGGIEVGRYIEARMKKGN